MGQTTPDITSNPEVMAFLSQIEPEARQSEAKALCEIFARASGQPPTLWGSAIIAFGMYHYRYDSGRQGEAPRVGFSPRKAKFVLYLHLASSGAEALLTRLGKHSVGKGCLYIAKLSDIDVAVLEEIVAVSFQAMAAAYPI